MREVVAAVRAAVNSLARASRRLGSAPKPMPKPKPFRRMMPARHGAWWIAAVLVALLFVGWLLNRQVVYTYLYFTEPEFKAAVEGRRWTDIGTQREARTRVACAGNRLAVRLLHAAGIRDDADGVSGVVCAVRQNDFEMVRTLLRLGDDLNKPAQALSGEPAVVRGSGLLLAPIAHAVQSGRDVMVDWLVTQGARPDAAAPHGAAAVHVAAMRHCATCLAQLRRLGADVNLGRPAIPLATWIDHAGAPESTTPQTLDRLKALGMNPRAAGADGRTALHAAAAHGDLAAVEWLVGQGADPGRQDHQGMTPLMHAAHGYLVPGSDPRRQLAVVLALLPRTPTLTAEATAAAPPGLPSILPAPVAPGWSLAMLAAREPTFRHAAKRQGKPLNYAGAPPGRSPWEDLDPQDIRATLSELSDDELSSGLWLHPSTDPSSWGLPYLAARLGWLDELRRMIGLGLLSSARADSQKLCSLLLTAAEGHGDASLEREASWTTLALLLDAGLSPTVCSPSEAITLDTAMALRNAAQVLRWQVRTQPGNLR